MARRSAEAQPRRWRPGARRRAVRPDPAWINTGGRLLASLAATVRRDGWELRPAPRRLGGPARKAADSLRTPGSHLLAVRHEGDLAGLVAIEPELDQLAPALIAAARLADPLIAADRRSGVGEHVRADRIVADGTRLARSLRNCRPRVLLARRARRGPYESAVGIQRSRLDRLASQIRSGPVISRLLRPLAPDRASGLRSPGVKGVTWCRAGVDERPLIGLGQPRMPSWAWTWPRECCGTVQKARRHETNVPTSRRT